MCTYGFEGYVWANLIWYFVHIDLANVLVELLYVGKLQEVSVWKERKGLEECKGRTCISSNTINGSNISLSYSNSSIVYQIMILIMVNIVDFLNLKSLTKLIETNVTGSDGRRCSLCNRYISDHLHQMERPWETVNLETTTYERGNNIVRCSNTLRTM